MNNQSFIKNKSIKVENLLPLPVTLFLTHMLLRYEHELRTAGCDIGYMVNNKPSYIKKGDPQVKDANVSVYNNTAFDTVTELVWPYMESIVGEPLIPTYTFARLYSNGNVLKKHTDKPECEISVTIQLGKSHKYKWPIYVGNTVYELNEGDGVLYHGDVPHERRACEGPEGYYTGQVFCHFVKARGSYSHLAGDCRWDGEIPFDRTRIINMIRNTYETNNA